MVPYYVSILIAAQFHRISYVFVLIPLMLAIKWKKAYWLVATVIALAINRLNITGVMSFVAARLHFARRYLHTDPSVLNNPVYILFMLCFILFLIQYRCSENNNCQKEKQQAGKMHISKH